MDRPRSRHYKFVDISTCAMCESEACRHRVLGKRLDRPQGIAPARKLGACVTVSQCDRCGLVYNNPQPVPRSVDDHYAISPHSYWNEDYFAFATGYLANEIARFKELREISDVVPGMRALDVGAGIGKGMVALLQAGFSAYGVEPSVPFRQMAIDKGIEPERLRLGCVEDASFPDQYFDFINLGAVLEHVYHPARVIESALGWLAPAGLMHAEVPSPRYLMSTLARWFYRVTGSDYVINTSPMHPPYHLFEFTAQSFVLHGKRAGYRVIHCDEFACSSYMPGPLDSLFRWLMSVTHTGMQLSVWLQRVQ